MKQNYQRKAQGLGDFLWGVLGCWMLGGMIGTWIALTNRGVEILQMPAWAWAFAVVGFSCGGALHWLACKLEDGSSTYVMLKIGAAGLVMGLGVFFLIGVFDDGAASSTQATASNILPIAQMKLGIARLCAWAALVGLPAVVAISNTVSVLALGRSKTGQEGGGESIATVVAVPRAGLNVERGRPTPSQARDDSGHPGYGA